MAKSYQELVAEAKQQITSTTPESLKSRLDAGEQPVIIDAAADGEAGLDAVRHNRPDLVVLDILLPGIDGLEVCRRIRADGNDVPVLMLTARDEVVDRVVGLETGADGYLVKPFAFEELVA